MPVCGRAGSPLTRFKRMGLSERKLLNSIEGVVIGEGFDYIRGILD
jgi:hypothetical protein